MDEFNRQYAESVKELEAEKKKLAAVEEAKKMGNNRFLWEEPMDNMGLEELEQYVAAMKEMKGKLAAKANDQSMNISTSMNMMIQPSSYNYDVDSLSWINIVGGGDHVGTSAFGFGGQGHCN